MVGQFFNHFDAVNALLGGMIEHMHPHEAQENVAEYVIHDVQTLKHRQLQLEPSGEVYLEMTCLWCFHAFSAFELCEEISRRRR